MIVLEFKMAILKKKGQKSGQRFALNRKHKEATVELSKLHREKALRSIALANETGEITPLIDAVKALQSSGELYFQDTVQIDNARIQKKLGDVLLNVGKDESNIDAIEAAIIAYKGAITIASMLGAENLRHDARKGYALAMNYAGKGDRTPPKSLMGAA